jgi:hypothetical protein
MDEGCHNDREIIERAIGKWSRVKSKGKGKGKGRRGKGKGKGKGRRGKGRRTYWARKRMNNFNSSFGVKYVMENDIQAKSRMK